MDRFLKLKHWLIFIIIAVLPVLIVGAMIVDVILSKNPFLILQYMVYLPIPIFLSVLVYFLWFWAVGVQLNKRLPEELASKIVLFIIALLFPLIYIIASVTLFGIFAGELLLGMVESIATIYVVLGVLQILSAVCSLYTLYFVAKTIKTTELQREVQFEEFALDIFSLLFFPIGIWFLQPRINKLVADN